MIRSARWRTFLGIVIAASALVATLWLINKRGHGDETTAQALENAETRVESRGSQAPTPVQPPSLNAPEEFEPPASPSPSQATSPMDPPPDLEMPGPSEPAAGFVGELKLIVPVAGVRRDQLQDTFADSRSEGRVHDALDIPAAAGTPVVAVADGEIIKLFQSDRGGTTIYQLSSDRRLVYYYAHLQRYADGLVAGKYARQGEVIGFVGDTGNAGLGNYHLHFSITIVPDPNRYWEGTNINPYPILRH